MGQLGRALHNRCSQCDRIWGIRAFIQVEQRVRGSEVVTAQPGGDGEEKPLRRKNQITVVLLDSKWREGMSKEGKIRDH